MITKYKFDRDRLVTWFTSRGQNIMHFFHKYNLSPSQMINFWKAVPTGHRIMCLQVTMREYDPAVNVLDFLIEK